MLQQRLDGSPVGATVAMPGPHRPHRRSASLPVPKPGYVGRRIPVTCQSECNLGGPPPPPPPPPPQRAETLGSPFAEDPRASRPPPGPPRPRSYAPLSQPRMTPPVRRSRGPASPDLQGSQARGGGVEWTLHRLRRSVHPGSARIKNFAPAGTLLVADHAVPPGRTPPVLLTRS